MTLPWMLGTEWPGPSGYLGIVLPRLESRDTIILELPAVGGGAMPNVSLTCPSSCWALRSPPSPPSCMSNVTGTCHGCSQLRTFWQVLNLEKSERKPHNIFLSLQRVGQLRLCWHSATVSLASFTNKGCEDWMFPRSMLSQGFLNWEWCLQKIFSTEKLLYSIKRN